MVRTSRYRAFPLFDAFLPAQSLMNFHGVRRLLFLTTDDRRPTTGRPTTNDRLQSAPSSASSCSWLAFDSFLKDRCSRCAKVKPTGIHDMNVTIHSSIPQLSASSGGMPY